MIKGTVISSTGLWYTVLPEGGEEVKARLKGKFRLKGRELTNPVAVGDEVILEGSGDDMVISQILQRRNYLIRKATRQSSQFHVVASNLDLAIILVTLRNPRTSIGFIDRFLVTCEAFDIPVLILINKVDILNNEELENATQLSTLYKGIGYPVITTSLKTIDDLSEIRSYVNHKTVLLFGHSGVGKSTLINMLVPDARQQVAEISDANSKGRHTTTFARMVLSADMRLIDIPGIKEFGLLPMEGWQIAHYFPEFREVLPNCRFNNCLHMREPGCAIREAVESGLLSSGRYNSYKSMLEGE
ncbi:MAG: ribosome small subunit-dependent GTPase A [Bacteroidetes bacterium]|nr:ribosome small subunit-dependent GTPase A [Bacteroidota bacterium]